MKKLSLIILLFLLTIEYGFSQKMSNEKITELITSYKNSIRGPYKDIRWFCTDGSLRQPKDPCPENIGPGVQHARYKDEVISLGETNHIFLGQILAYTQTEEFWDVENNHSRLKQYQLDKYLRSVDDGWINRKGQFYRGSVQSEDEEAWGISFYKMLLSNDDNLDKNYFLIRQSLKDIPHNGDDNISQLIRSQSKVISNTFPPFMDLRVKIHSQPEYSDIQKVKSFKDKNTSKLNKDVNLKLEELIETMTKFYKPIDISTLLSKKSLVSKTEIGQKIKAYIVNQSNNTSVSELITGTSEI